MPASYLGHLSAVSLQMAQVQQELSMSEPDPPPGAEDEADVQGNRAAPAPALKLPKWLQEWAQGVVPSQDTVEQAAGTMLSREQPVKGRARESINVGRIERAARRGAQAVEREDEEGLTRLGGERTSSMLPYSPEPAEPGPLPFLSQQLPPQGSLPPLYTGRGPAGQDVLREVQQERAAAFEEFRMRTRQQQPQQQQQQQQQMRPYQQQQQLGGAPRAGAMQAPRRASEPVRPCYNPVLPPPSLSRYIPPVFVAPAPSPSSAQEGSSARMQGTSASGSVQDTSEGVEGDAAEDEQISEAIIDEEESSEDSVEVTRRSRRRGKGTRTAKSPKAADAGAASFMPRQRAPTQRARPAGGTSKRKGVTRHRHTLRWEAHLWDNSAPRSQEKNALTGAKKGRTRGKQVYLGGFASETEAARAYDRAAIVYYGPKTQLNGKITDYAAELDTLKKLSRQEVVAMLRKSSGFSRGLACQPFADSD